MALRPAVFDRHILSLDVADFAQSLAERGHKRFNRRAGRPRVEDTDHRHRFLLRSYRECDCHRTARERKKLTTPHSNDPIGAKREMLRPVYGVLKLGLELLVPLARMARRGESVRIGAVRSRRT